MASRLVFKLLIGNLQLYSYNIPLLDYIVLYCSAIFITKITCQAISREFTPEKILVYEGKGGIFNLKKYLFLIKKGVYFDPKILEKGVFVKSWNTR